jgi:hypothetical protein
MKPPEYDDPILKTLEDLPEKWKSNNDNKMTLNVTVDREDATWISNRIYQDVDRGLISSVINTTKSENSVDLAITLNVNIDLATIIPALTLLVYELKTKTITRYLNRKRKLSKFVKKEKKVKT